VLNVSPPIQTQARVMRKTTRGLGITQLLFGVLTFGVGIASAMNNSYIWTTYIGSTFWGGMLMMATGTIGVLSAKHQTSNKLNGVNLALSIMSALAGLVNCGLFASGMAFLDQRCQHGKRYGYDYDYGYYYKSFHNRCHGHKGGVGLHSVVMLVGVAEFFVGVVAAAYCCAALCACCQQKKAQQFVAAAPGQQWMAPAPGAQPVMMTSSAGQPMMMASTAGHPAMMVSSQIPVQYSTAATQPMMMYPAGQQAFHMPQQPQLVYSQQLQPQNTPPPAYTPQAIVQEAAQAVSQTPFATSQAPIAAPQAQVIVSQAEFPQSAQASLNAQACQGAQGAQALQVVVLPPEKAGLN